MQMLPLPTHMPRIIALCGVKRSGKDTAASFIASAFGYQHVKFAGRLKDCCRLLFNLSDEQLEGRLKEVEDPRWQQTPRRIMQFFGTELMQIELQRLIPGIGTSFWVKQLLEAHRDQCIVISDMRFVHEAREVMQNDPNALIIRVERNDAPHDDPHVSEAGVHSVPCHTVVSNNGSITDLEAQLKVLLETIRIGALGRPTRT